MKEIFRGDDTQSFGQNWLQIEADIPDTWMVERADFKVGNLPAMSFDNPTFPLTVNLTASQSIMLKDENTCYLALYDSEGLKQTCEGSFSFKTKPRRA